jgi:putative ABC transport system permease protein
MRTHQIAFRNLTRQKKRSLLLGGAIAFGLLVITLINGFTAGLRDNLKENLSYTMGGHLFLAGTETSKTGRSLPVIRNDQALKAALTEAGLSSLFVTERSVLQATLVFGNKQVVQTVNGVNWGQESFFQERLRLQSGSLEGLKDKRSLILGAAAAKRLKVQVGDSLMAKTTTYTGQQNVDEMIVVGILADAGSVGSNAYARLDYVNELLNLQPGEYQQLAIYLKDMGTMDQDASRLYDLLKSKVTMNPRMGTQQAGAGGSNQWDSSRAGMAMIGGGGGAPGGAMRGGWGGAPGAGGQAQGPQGPRFTLTTLNDLMGPYLSILNVLDTVALGVFLVLLTITMVGVTNTFRMILIERTREIGTLRALGMHRDQVRNLFLWEALQIAVLGAAAGVVLAQVLGRLLTLVPLANTGFLSLFLKADHLGFGGAPLDLVLDVVLLLASSLLAAYFPAKRASRVEPALALRTSY